MERARNELLPYILGKYQFWITMFRFNGRWRGSIACIGWSSWTL